jgi:hypothetical protein
MRKLLSLKPLVIAAAVLAAALMTAVAVELTGTSAPSPMQVATQQPAGRAGDAAHTRPSYMRTLAVYTRTEPAPSAHPERMRALLTAGRLPTSVVRATVLTDEDCAADAKGVSHCRNRLKLPDGRTVTVRHPHRMADVPCMTPGETVLLRRAVDAKNGRRAT